MSVLAGVAARRSGRRAGHCAGSDERAVAGELFATEALPARDWRASSSTVGAGTAGCSPDRTFPVFARGVAPCAFPARSMPVIQVPLTIGWGRRPARGHPARRRRRHRGRRRRRARGGDRCGPSDPVPRGGAAGVDQAGTSLFTAMNFDEHAASTAGGPAQLTWRFSRS